MLASPTIRIIGLIMEVRSRKNITLYFFSLPQWDFRVPAPTNLHDQRDWGPTRVRVRPGLPLSGMLSSQTWPPASLAGSFSSTPLLLAASCRTQLFHRDESCRALCKS